MVESIINIAKKYGIDLSVEEAKEVLKEINRWFKPSVEIKGKVVKTYDGSFTRFSEEYGEPYHSITAGAVRECYGKFILPSGLLFKAKFLKRIFILDIGFGLGYNTAVAIYHLKLLNRSLDILIYSFDKNIPFYIPPLPEPYAYTHRMVVKGLPCFEKDGIYFRYVQGDARKTLKFISNFYFDVIFHDPFSPFRNPEMWTLDFLKLLKEKLKSGGTWVSYTSSLCVRKALYLLNLSVKESIPLGRKRKGTVAIKYAENYTDENIKKRLKESPYAIPLRDENLNSDPFDILVRYFSEVIKLKTEKGRHENFPFTYKVHNVVN